MRRSILTAALLLPALLLLGRPGPLAALEDGPVVVELFTSQGCSSCPPADAYIGELADREGVLALSFHVRLWDYIGWPDPFASVEAGERQRAYGESLGLRFIYTPQMVVDGRNSASSRGAIEAMLAEATSRPRIPVSMRAREGSTVIGLPAAEGYREAVVWVVFFDREHETRVPRGENRGRTIRNFNVVREIRRIGTWSGEAAEIVVPVADAAEAGRDGCIVLVQEGGSGPVIGAARLMLDG